MRPSSSTTASTSRGFFRRMPLSVFGSLRATTLLLPWLAWLLAVDASISLLLPLKLLSPRLCYDLSSGLAGTVWSWIQNIFVVCNKASIVVRSRDHSKSSASSASSSSAAQGTSADIRRRPKSSTASEIGARAQSPAQKWLLPRGESAVVIANHVTWSDFWLIQQAAIEAGMLSRCRWFAKSALRWVPFLGWGMWAMEFPMVTRKFASDQAELRRVFRDINEKKLPIWLISYSEGTRFTTSKRLEAEQWCAQHARPLAPHVLYPRTRGFVATVRALRNGPRDPPPAVYDLTLAYARGTAFMQAPSFWQALSTPDLSAVGYRFYVAVDRFEMRDLPAGEEELATWLEGRWLEKGRRLEGLRRALEAGRSWDDDDDDEGEPQPERECE